MHTHHDEKPKSRTTTKVFFWLFILLTILCVFLFWTGKGKGFSTAVIAGIIALCLALLFAIICFIRFLRARSIAGGLFLTTCISTGVFLGASQLLPVIVPPTAAAFSNSPEATNAGLETIIFLAQIGLFAIWFCFLLFTIYIHVRPVKRIDKYLQRIVNGDDIKKVHVGRVKQYKNIEENLLTLASKNEKHDECAIQSAVVCTLMQSTDSVQAIDGT